MVAGDGGTRSQRNLNDKLRSSDFTSPRVGNTQNFCREVSKGNIQGSQLSLKSTREFSIEK